MLSNVQLEFIDTAVSVTATKNKLSAAFTLRPRYVGVRFKK
jgi:hypothetical protein